MGVAHPGAPEAYASVPEPVSARAVPFTMADLAAAAAPYRVDPLTVAYSKATFPHAGAVQLYRLRFERVLASGLSAIYAQRVFTIRAVPDLFVLDNIWYDSSRNTFHLLRADVYRHGQVLHGSDAGDLHPGATGNQPRCIQLPPLRVGDRVDVEYELAPVPAAAWSVLDGHFLGNLVAFRDTYPTARARYVLQSSGNLAVGQDGVAAPTETVGPNGLHTWLWSASNQPAFFHVPGGPSLTDASPFVQVSGFRSWAQMANWYGGLLARRARMAPAFQTRLLSLLRPEASLQPVSTPAGREAMPLPGSPYTAAQARAVIGRAWDYLSGHLNYLGNESGVHAYVPSPVEQVFAAGQGDCKDGALLLVTWLRAAGIEADLALVRTPSMGRIVTGSMDAAGGQAPRPSMVPATMAAFDHALVYVPVLHEYIDTTAPDLLPGELPSSDQNSLALIVRTGEDSLQRIPDAPAAANLTRRTVRLTPLSGGWLQASGTIAVRGADAAVYRDRYADADQRSTRLEYWLRDYFPQAQVESVHVSGIDPAGDAVQVNFRARIHPRRLTVAWLARHYADEMASAAARSESLRVPLRWTLEESWSLQLPAVGDCSRLAADKPIHRSGPFGGLDVTTTCRAGWLSVRSDVTQDAERVSSAQYPAYRRFWRGIDGTLDARLPLQWTAPAPEIKQTLEKVSR